MVRFIGRRLAFMVLTVILASGLIFGLTQILPGDIATVVLGRFAPEEAKEELREELGLNRPLVVQYGTWLADFATGDWGTSLSIISETDVKGLVAERLWNSAKLAFVAFLMYIPLGILLGCIAAQKQGTWLDHTLSIGALAVVGLPEFVTGVILITIFALQLDWLPASSAIGDAGFLEALPQMILPAITISLASLAYIIRMTRSSTISVNRTEYIRTARLKGLSQRKVLFTHVLRNSLPPTVTVTAMSVVWLFSGLVVTEQLFNYPGFGKLILFSIQRHDFPLIQATIMVVVLITVLANLIADVLHAFMNPRVRY